MANKCWADFLAFLYPADRYASLGRLLLFMALSVVVMIPYTQRAWIWDRFLQGGHDFETNILLILCCFCLVLVMLRSGRQSLDNLFALLRVLLRPPERPRRRAQAAVCVLHSEQAADPWSAHCTFPLQI